MKSKQTLPKSTDVLIVGAGPTGLALAITLKQAGVDHVLIDSRLQMQNTSRAAVIHAHTLEVLRQLGVADEMVAQGRTLKTFSIYDRSRILLKLPFDTLPSDYPFLLMIPQDATEAILAKHLVNLEGVVHLGVTATHVLRTGDQARVTVNTGDSEQAITSRFVVGADGMHSKVRESAGIGFTGSQYEHSFVLADVRMDWAHGCDDVKLFFSPAGLAVVAPLPNGAFRIVAPVENAVEKPGAADIESIIVKRGPKVGKVRVTDVLWSSRFRLHHRLADAYRSGPIFLIGDAAHVHSPAGGQGMNTGLVDAYVLGRLLSSVISGSHPEAALDFYEKLRRPAAGEVLKLADGLTQMATVTGGVARMLRNLRLTAVGHLPFAKRQLLMNLSGLARRNAAELPFDKLAA